MDRSFSDGLALFFFLVLLVLGIASIVGWLFF